MMQSAMLYCNADIVSCEKCGSGTMTTADRSASAAGGDRQGPAAGARRAAGRRRGAQLDGHRNWPRRARPAGIHPCFRSRMRLLSACALDFESSTFNSERLDYAL